MRRGKRQAHRRKRKARKLALQPLEARKMLAADIGFSDGWIHVSGTEQDDLVEMYEQDGQIVVSALERDATGATVDKNDAVFDAGEVVGVFFEGNAGNDVFVNDTDVRVVAASNKDLKRLVEEGKFREDLYYRLSVVPIHIPPLRERGDDVVWLFRMFAHHFADKYNTEPLELTPEAEEVLKRYPWPGNVRQLKHLVEQLTVLAPQRVLTPEILEKFLPEAPRQLPVLRQDIVPSMAPAFAASEQQTMTAMPQFLPFWMSMHEDLNVIKDLLLDLHQRLATPSNQALPGHTDSTGSGQQNPNSAQEDDEILPLDELERRMIIKALKKFNGRRREAAKALGISERTLYRKIKQYNLDL